MWGYIIINTCMMFIRVFIIDSTIAPKNDPGIKIWWLCNLRFGQKGIYKDKYLQSKKRYEI